MGDLPYAESFRDLLAYQKARQLSREIFQITKAFPREELFSLTDQIRRSSRSIGAQIAEAWAKRRYERYFLSKLTDADGEQQETRHWIETAGLLGMQKNLVAEYVAARTPNPCPICNRRLKFGKMMEFAAQLGARYFATGHYARVVRQDGVVRLCRASRAEQDQSYMLFNIRRDVLQRVMFPLGELDKQTVRQLARPYESKGAELVVGVESRGFIFGALVAAHLHAGFVPIRKPGKLPRKVLSREYTLEYGEYKYSYTIRPLQRKVNLMDLSKKRFK